MRIAWNSGFRALILVREKPARGPPEPAGSVKT